MEKEKQVTLSKNGFLFKIIKFTFGLDPSLAKSLCPVFWLFLASLLLCIPVGILKGFKIIAEKILKALVNGFGKFLDYVDNSWYENKYLDSLSNSQIYYLKCKVDQNWKVVGKGEEFFDSKIDKASRAFKKILDDVMKKRGLTNKDIDLFKEDYYKEINEFVSEKERKEDEYREKKIRDTKKEKEMRETLYKISDVFKKIFQGIFIIVLGIICFALSMLLCNFWIWSFAETTSWQWLIDVGIDALIFIGIIAGGALVVISVLYLYKFLNKRYNININFQNPIFKPFIWLVMGIYYVFWIGIYKMLICGVVNGFCQGFTEFGGVFGKYFSAAYSDYCPMIEWEDDNNDSTK